MKPHLLSRTWMETGFHKWQEKCNESKRNRRWFISKGTRKRKWCLQNVSVVTCLLINGSSLVLLSQGTRQILKWSSVITLHDHCHAAGGVFIIISESWGWRYISRFSIYIYFVVSFSVFDIVWFMYFILYLNYVSKVFCNIKYPPAHYSLSGLGGMAGGGGALG